MRPNKARRLGRRRLVERQVKTETIRGLYWRGTLALLAAACSARAPSAEPKQGSSGPLSAAITESRAQILTLLHDGFPGVSVAVAVDGTIVWAEGFGLADVGTHRPITPTTALRIGSVSKSLTSAAIGQLVDAHRLDLDAPVQQYVPDFPDKGATITPRLIAGHLAGLRHYRGREMASTRHCDHLHDGLAIFENDPLLFAPGERTSYSSYGWNLLGTIVEAASGESYPEYMAAHVLAPAKLTRTFLEDVHAPADRASPYQIVLGHPVVAPQVDNSCKWPSGGWLATPSDLVRYALALENGTLMSDATRGMLFTPVRTTGGAETGYGLGWQVSRDKSSHLVISHSGSAIGGLADLELHPEQHVIIALIANGNGASQLEREFLDTAHTISEQFVTAAAAHGGPLASP